MNADHRAYHWTESLKDMFLETLARTGSVRRAAASVEKSPRAAYNLRRRHDGTAFALAWDTALLVARERLGDLILERALEPVKSVGTPHPVTGRWRWQSADPLLGRGMGRALLSRLDRAHARIMSQRSQAIAAQRLMCELWQKSGSSGSSPRPFAAPTPRMELADAFLRHRLHDPAWLAVAKPRPYLPFHASCGTGRVIDVNVKQSCRSRQ